MKSRENAESKMRLRRFQDAMAAGDGTAALAIADERCPEDWSDYELHCWRVRGEFARRLLAEGEASTIPATFREVLAEREGAGENPDSCERRAIQRAAKGRLAGCRIVVAVAGVPGAVVRCSQSAALRLLCDVLPTAGDLDSVIDADGDAIRIDLRGLRAAPDVADEGDLDPASPMLADWCPDAPADEDAPALDRGGRLPTAADWRRPDR